MIKKTKFIVSTLLLLLVLSVSCKKEANKEVVSISGKQLLVNGSPFLI